MRKNRWLSCLMPMVALFSLTTLASCGEEERVPEHFEAMAATCTDDGNVEYWSLDGVYYADEAMHQELSQEDIAIQKLGHDYKDLSFVWEDDCSAAIAQWTCSRDSAHVKIAEEQVVVSDTTTPATCGLDGSIVYTASVTIDGKEYVDSRTVEISKTGAHSYADVWNSDSDHHFHECSVCGEKKDVASHEWEWVVDKKASVSETGLRHEECKTCHRKTNEGTVIDKLAVTTHIAKAPTCTEEGNILYYETSDGKCYTDEFLENEIAKADTIIAKNEHILADWKHDEENHWKECSTCDEKFLSETHTLSEVIDSQPTEDTAGKKHKECSTCGYKTQEEEIPATGIVTKIEAKAATCTEAGNIEYWTLGGKYYSDEECKTEIALDATVIPANGHTLPEQYSSDENEHWQVCSVCGEEIPDSRKSHDFGDGTVTAPTCAEKGYTTYTCSTCGKEKVGDEVDATGHTYDSSVFKEEKYYKVCSNDGHREAVDVNEELSVKVNDKEYKPYICETTGKVSFDPLNNTFVILLDGTNFKDEDLKIEGVDAEIVLKVSADTNVKSLTFANGFRKLDIVGDGKLTIVGNLTSEANPTYMGANIEICGNLSCGNATIDSDITVLGTVVYNTASMTINSGNVIIKGNVQGKTFAMFGGIAYLYSKLYVQDLTIGSKELTTSPILNIRGGGMTNDNIPWVGTNAVNYQIVKGIVNIQKDGDGYFTGIDIKGSNEGSVVKVCSGATLNVNGFNHGVYFESSDGKLQIEGNANIYATENGTNNTNVLIDGGTLVLKTEAWGIYKGAMTFNSGKATLIKKGFGYGAFYQITGLSIAEGFDLGIKNFNQIVYDSPSILSYDSVMAVITTQLNGEEDQGKLNKKYQSGTVTPDDLTLASIPTYDELTGNATE